MNFPVPRCNNLDHDNDDHDHDKTNKEAIHLHRALLSSTNTEPKSKPKTTTLTKKEKETLKYFQQKQQEDEGKVHLRGIKENDVIGVEVLTVIKYKDKNVRNNDINGRNFPVCSCHIEDHGKENNEVVHLVIPSSSNMASKTPTTLTKKNKMKSKFNKTTDNEDFHVTNSKRKASPASLQMVLENSYRLIVV